MVVGVGVDEVGFVFGVGIGGGYYDVVIWCEVVGEGVGCIYCIGYVVIDV